MFHFNISQTFLINEQLYKKLIIKPANLYSQLSPNLTLQDLINKLKLDVKNLDINLAIANFYYQDNSLKKALDFANKSVLISNSYHSYFHYFGFNIATKIYKQNNQNKYKDQALFFYPHGTQIEESFLPPYKNLCIFENSDLHKNFYSYDIDILKQTFEQSCEEHLRYHLITADIFLLRGMIWKELNKPEIARVDLEKALKMELKNPKNDLIKLELKKLLYYV